MVKSEQKRTKWTATQRKFIAWFAMPKDLREPNSIGEIAAELKVGRTALWQWRKLPGFNEEAQLLIKRNMGDALPEVIETLKEMARRGSFAHMKMYLEMLDIYKPVVRNEVSGKNGGDLTIKIVYEAEGALYPIGQQVGE